MRKFSPFQRLPLALAASLLAGAAAFAADTPAVNKLLGFSATSSDTQRQLETRFDGALDIADYPVWLKQMSSAPNHVGSPHDKANAEFVLAKFREWGWDAHIETFNVLYPMPKSESLELVAPSHFTAALKEPAVAGDATSTDASGLPPYVAYGADGDVTADLVYVNQGMPDDYDELARHGIDVRGKIVITRYGGGWRGLKPKLAQQHGAIGCLIYSDPQQDGYGAGEVYPAGGYRPPDGVQRGSVADMPIYPGDPLTPGIGATKDAKRLAVADAKTVLKIPVLPISYADAQPLLAALGGPVAPKGWRGALPITYHIGPGAAQVHLAVQSDWSLKPAYDVIAKLKGSELPDEWVIRGNHRDGWVFGAWDPLSGHVAMMEEAKAIGALAQQGWKPKRTLVYASWDGEEPGLIGSTEWVETHADELRDKAVLYVNSDTNSRGFLGVAGSHSLQAFADQLADDVIDPETGVTVDRRLRALAEVEGYAEGAGGEEKARAKIAASDADLPIEPLGSGSDFSPFLQHLGIATLSLEYGGEDDDGGIYHSDYDSYDHYVRFGDPGFKYGLMLSKTIGRAMLRFADADVLPMRFEPFSTAVGDYTDEIHKLVDSLRTGNEALENLLSSNAFKLAGDPTKTYLAPERKAAVPYLNLAPLDNSLLRLKKSTKAFDAAYSKSALADTKATDPRRAQLDKLLGGMEHALINTVGLPGRDWYQHMIYAPGLYTGYGVKTLPGLREAIEQRDFAQAERYAGIIAGNLDAYSARLDQATALLAAP